ncbi:hypothetical protein BDV95DRAFT_594247 [Massariosphaeria phaeospora]|uniref:Uncharacterized protein n=1 Tax=Massariosphaeria phaeospora TaxID=100035 RepID=A0A7C8MAC4_9PLEO|nr:hypothetical protein BDV95DRAFT_594247 [Massariosphaeria phaeospora]
MAVHPCWIEVFRLWLSVTPTPGGGLQLPSMRQAAVLKGNSAYRLPRSALKRRFSPESLDETTRRDDDLGRRPAGQGVARARDACPEGLAVVLARVIGPFFGHRPHRIMPGQFPGEVTRARFLPSPSARESAAALRVSLFSFLFSPDATPRSPYALPPNQPTRRLGRQLQFRSEPGATVPVAPVSRTIVAEQMNERPSSHPRPQASDAAAGLLLEEGFVPVCLHAAGYAIYGVPRPLSIPSPPSIPYTPSPTRCISLHAARRAAAVLASLPDCVRPLSRRRMAEPAATRWDRARWISVFSSHNPTIREVTENLGLGLSAASSTTNRGIPKFDNPDYRKLSSDVTRLSKDLPKERDPLLDFAADPRSLDSDLEGLLATYGPVIWGRDSDRSCLLTAAHGKKTYPKDLFYEDPEDKAALKIHLHRWIVIKACYYIRNMKLKRSSVPGESDNGAEMVDIDGLPRLSPYGTPRATTPVSSTASADQATAAAYPPDNNLRKRKSSAHLTMSDGEDGAPNPAKRPYHNGTLPNYSQSPRTSLKSVAESPSAENIPPAPVQHVRDTKPILPSSSQVPSRPLLTPLTSNDLNGAARPSSVAPALGGFTAVNTGGFTAVNTASPILSSTPAPDSVHAVQNAVPSQHASPVVPHRTPIVHHTTPPAQHTIPSQQASPPVHASIAPSPKPALPPALAPQPPTASTDRHYSSPYGNVNAQRSRPPSASAAHVPPIITSGWSGGFATIAKPQPSSRSHTPLTQHISRPHTNQHGPNTSMAHNHSYVISATHPCSNSSTPATSTPRTYIPPSASSVPQPMAYYTAPPRTVLKSHTLDMARRASKTPHYTPDFELMQCELLGVLMQYFFPRSAHSIDEETVLVNIEYVWASGQTQFRHAFGASLDARAEVLSTWIAERRKMHVVRVALAAAPAAVAVAEMADRLLALNDLRAIRLKWKSMGARLDAASSEDLLCRTFATMTNTEGTEYVFRDGLERLGDGIFAFLKSQDMTISIARQQE